MGIYSTSSGMCVLDFSVGQTSAFQKQKMVTPDMPY